MRSLRFFLALVLSTFALAACTPVQTPQPTDPEESTSTSPPQDEFVPPNWPEMSRTSASGIEGLDTYVIGDHDAHAHAVVPQITGHEQFNSFLSGWAKGLTQEFIDDFEKSGEVPDSGWLSITWDATAVSESIIGIVLDTSINPGASTMSAQQVFWYDPEAGDLLAWQSFLTSAALEELPAEIVTRLKDSSDEIGAGDIDVEALPTLFDDDELSVGFSATGNLVITFDSYALLAGSFGAPSVEFSSQQTANWLTEAGKRARAATLDPDVAAVPKEPLQPESPGTEVPDCEQVDCVALTFDDGPGSSTTPKLLKVLEEQNVPATFFMLGSQAQSFPQIVADAAAAGHEIASHTWNHPNLPALSDSALRKQLRRTNKVLEEITGVDMTLMRPPYGATSSAVAKAAKSAGVAQIFWNIDTRDWDHHDPKKTIAAAAKAKPGSIILMHDIHPETIEAVPGVIKALQKKGYVFVTVSTLLGETTPGKQYRSK